MWTYVWKAALIALVPSLIVGTLVALAMPDKGPSFDGPVVMVVLGLLVLSPWVETLLMWPILWILKRLFRKLHAVALASAVIWGLLHSLMAPAWGLVILWVFFVFSVCFLEWEKKSKGKAIVATASVHMCQNLIPALAILLSQ